MDQRFVLNTERGRIFSLSHGICLTAKIYGDIDNENFNLALNKMLKRYPIFKCSLETEADGEWYLSLKHDKEFEPVYYPYGEVNYIEKHIEKEERNPYDLMNGPLFKMIVFKGEGRSMAAFMAAPVISDAISLKEALEKVVYYLNHAEEEAKAEALHKESATQVEKKEHLLTLKERLTVGRVNHLWKRQCWRFTPDEYALWYRSYHKQHNTPIMRKEIRSRSTQSLLANCKNKEVSVDAALLTAFIAVVDSFDKCHFGREVPIHYSVDIRDQIPYLGNAGIGMLSSTIAFKKSYVQQQSFWDNVKAVDEVLKSRRTSRKQCLRERMLCSRLNGTLVEALPFVGMNEFDSEAAKRTLLLLNQGYKERGIGLYPMKEIAYKTEEEYYIDSINVIPPACGWNDLTIGSCIVNERLRLCIRYDKGHYSEHIVEEMVRTAVNYMWNRTET